MLEQRAREKELSRFRSQYEAKLKECHDQQAIIEPILVKLWDLAGQPDVHATLDSH